MKTILILGLFLSSVAHAVEIKFIGPCMEDFIMKTEVSEEFENVGELTIATLTKWNILFTGTPEGLSSAFDTPVGSDAIERVSSDEYRAYGWCFSVDGVSPDHYPNEIPLTGVKEVVWTFGFARNVRGEWITQCTPSYTVKPASLCQDPTAER